MQEKPKRIEITFKLVKFVELVLCPAIRFSILLKVRHDELIHESITLHYHVTQSKSKTQ